MLQFNPLNQFNPNTWMRLSWIVNFHIGNSQSNSNASVWFTTPDPVLFSKGNEDIQGYVYIESRVRLIKANDVESLRFVKILNVLKYRKFANIFC